MVIVGEQEEMNNNINIRDENNTYSCTIEEFINKYTINVFNKN